MTIKRAWEGLLEGAARSFLDHYWVNGYVDTGAEVEVWDYMLKELTERMNARFHDEWLALRAERVDQRMQDHAAAGQTAIPPERVQEVKDAVAQQLQDHAAAGHPDEEELMAEAEVRGGA